MHKSALLLLFLLPVFGFTQSDSVTIMGKVLNAYTGEPLNNVPVELLLAYGTQADIILSNADGTYQFTSSRHNRYYLLIEEKEYIRKSFAIKDSNDVVEYDLRVRPRTETLSSSAIDSTDLGSFTRKIFKRFSLDERDISIINEPPGKTRGFKFELADSSLVYILIEKAILGREQFKEIKKEKIVAIVIANVDGTHTQYGSWEWFHTSFYNPYVLDRERESE